MKENKKKKRQAKGLLNFLTEKRVEVSAILFIALSMAPAFFDKDIKEPIDSYIKGLLNIAWALPVSVGTEILMKKFRVWYFGQEAVDNEEHFYTFKGVEIADKHKRNIRILWLSVLFILAATLFVFVYIYAAK
ncbi:hypothetical protein ACFL2D_01235 [Patescibacteria group bacterium]